MDIEFSDAPDRHRYELRSAEELIGNNIDKVEDLRTQLRDDAPDGVEVQVTGPAGIQADIGQVFDGANLRLLLSTAGVVALLLIITYRSPVLWLVPLAVVGIADRLSAVVATNVLEAFTAWPGTSRRSAS